MDLCELGLCDTHLVEPPTRYMYAEFSALYMDGIMSNGTDTIIVTTRNDQPISENVSLSAVRAQIIDRKWNNLLSKNIPGYDPEDLHPTNIEGHIGMLKEALVLVNGRLIYNGDTEHGELGTWVDPTPEEQAIVKTIHDAIGYDGAEGGAMARKVRAAIAESAPGTSEAVIKAVAHEFIVDEHGKLTLVDYSEASQITLPEGNDEREQALTLYAALRQPFEDPRYAADPHTIYAQTTQTIRIQVGDVTIPAPARVELPEKRVEELTPVEPYVPPLHVLRPATDGPVDGD